jgi:hypothetical protein
MKQIRFTLTKVETLMKNLDIIYLREILVQETGSVCRKSLR